MHTHQATATGEPRVLVPFWNISSQLKCPVAGCCLTGAEQRHLVAQMGLPSSGYNDFELHEILVGWTDEENPLARRVDSLLRKKYYRAALPLLELDTLNFITHWEQAFASGDFATALWAAASRADMVLCPVNCNSHGACLLVKKMCKKHKKALHIMPNFSLNAVSRVLSQSVPTCHRDAVASA